MRTVSSPSQSRPRLTTVVQSPCSSPTLPPLPPPSLRISTLSLPSSTSRFRWASPSGCPFASPPTRPNSPSTPSPLLSSPRTLMNSSPASASQCSTPRTFVSSPPDTSTQTLHPGRACPPPPSSSQSTPGTSQQLAPPYASSPAGALSSVLTPLIDTRSARTAGSTDTSLPDAPRLILSAPSAPSTTPVPCTGAPTLRALEEATLRLLLAVVLPHHPDAPTAKAPILRLTGIVTPARLRPLSGVPPLPKRLFSRHQPVTRWTRPPTKTTSRPPLHPPALSRQRSRWLLQEPEAQRFFRPQ